MRAFHTTAMARSSQRRALVAPGRMMILALFGIVGAAGTMAVFRRMLDTLGDPMPATIMTLVVLLMVLVTFGKGTTRP